MENNMEGSLPQKFPQWHPASRGMWRYLNWMKNKQVTKMMESFWTTSNDVYFFRTWWTWLHRVKISRNITIELKHFLKCHVIKGSWLWIDPKTWIRALQNENSRDQEISEKKGYILGLCRCSQRKDWSQERKFLFHSSKARSQTQLVH